MLPLSNLNTPMLFPRPSPEHTVQKRATSNFPNPHCSVGNKQLLSMIKEHFREYATGANDRYVNFNELKEAAGLCPTTRTFSAEATAAAKELLERPKLLRELDIGIGFLGFAGSEDQRFDIQNLDRLIKVNRRTVTFCRQGKWI
ncbi:hypothetical protein [Pseudomonas sp. R2-60-08W]|uniref:hypothetical protein n=1 Tax=Pseudomonas sp. R2-60-08W TaxID=1173280 RepID=UPI000F6CEA38|nr:hypothetical protein [Pseudomonas sp. R2-60-08W]AZF27155.1 hypothetical protein C4J90_2984 [Pseudomonas sp. R2-60-08W]